MAAKRGGDSKQGLIIALVCFVILSIVLGVFTWLGYSGQTDANKAAEDAAKKEKAAYADRDWYKFQAVQYRDYLGHPPVTADASALETLRKSFPGGVSGDGKEEVTKLVQDLDAKLGWDPSKNKSTKNYKLEEERLNTDLASTRAKLDDAQKNLKKLKDNYDNQIATKEMEVQEWKKKYEGAQAANLKDHQDREQALEDKLKEFGDLTTQLGNTRKKAEDDQAKADKEKSRLLTRSKELQGMVKKLNDKLTPPDLLKFSTPKGKVVRLDLRGEIAWINIGSDDNVRADQDLTFSVFGTGQGGKSDNVRKGSMEVVEVIAPHLSMAKITEVVDPSRNPIVTGDLLINPAWNPGTRQHVAIAGFIDLTGEGRNNIDEFMSNLRKQGMVIDAWLDLNDLTVKGEGLNMETNYLIVGALPEVKDEDILKAQNTGAEERRKVSLDRTKDIIDKISALQKDARDLGITVLPLHKFVAMTGYHLPKGAGVTQGFGYEARQKKSVTPEAKSLDKKSEETKDDSDK